MPNEKAAEPLSEEKLAKIEGLESKATRSPWSAFDPEGVECGRLCTPDGCQGHASGMFELDGPPRADDWPDTHLFTCEADAKLIAEARNALPSLLAEVRLGRDLPRGLRFVPDEQGGHLVDDGGLVWRPVARPR